MAGNLDFRLNLLANTTGLQQGMNGAKFAVNALVAAMAAVGVGVSVKGLADAADSYTTLSARINIATKDGGNFTSAMAGVHQVALMTNSSLEATGNLFTKINDTGKQMGMTQQQALDLTKTINQAVQIGGGSAQASEAAVQQFIQALQSGVLRGDEFNSIMEQAPGLTSAMAKGIGVTTGELRKMAENGELGAERITKAIQSQAGQIQATYDKFPTTIGNALTKISTQWQILIGTMDQANGASSTVADWLVVLADNIADLDIVLNDIGEGFVWVGDQLKKVDSATIEALKTALVSAYDTIKELGSTVGIAFEEIFDILNTTLSQIFNFNSGLETASDKTSGLTKLLQALNVVIGFISDGFSAIGIGVNLLTGAIYDVASAFTYWKSKLLFGDAKDQALKEYEELAAKAQEYYTKASNGAMEFKSKGVEALNEISKTQKEKDAESVASSKAKMESLLADQKTEVDGKKATEAEKLSAVQTYAEAAIKANGGVMDGVMQADLLTKGYIVTLGESGKVGVEAWSKNKDGAESTANATDKARKAAVALGLDLDVSLNRVSAKFKENGTNVDNFVAGLKGLGVTGKQAGDVTYEAWLKWLEAAKSQAEIDAANAKMREFEAQGVFSTKQVEIGMLALRQVIQKLPADLDPVEQAFERLGIKTKENLKLAAQSALADFNTIQASGKATAEGIRQAYERTMQAAAASGDAGVIAATNAKAASAGLSVQIDETGKAVVQTTSEWVKANVGVENSARGIGDGYRHAGQIAREEAESSTEAWAKAVDAASAEFSKSGLVGVQMEGYTLEGIKQKLKDIGYTDEKQINQKANELFKVNAADRVSTIMSRQWELAGQYPGMLPDKKAANLMAITNKEYIDIMLDGLSSSIGNGSNATKSIGSSTKPVNVNNLAPNVSTPIASPTTTNASKDVNYNINFGGQTLSLSGSAEQESVMNQLINQLKTQAKST